MTTTRTDSVVVNQVVTSNTAGEAVLEAKQHHDTTANTVVQGFSASSSIPYNQIHFGKSIGYGSFATVYKGRLKYKTVALKKLKGVDPTLLQNFEQESRIMQEIQNASIKNAVKYYGYAKDPSTQSYVLVLEYVPKGEMFDWICAYNLKREFAPWALRYSYLAKTAEGILSFHNNHFIHRDLKWENVLRKNNKEIKICDVGFAVKLVGDTFRDTKCPGTPYYVAPESWTENKFSRASDVYAFAIMMYVMAEQSELAFSFPVGVNEIPVVMRSGDRPVFRHLQPGELMSLIEACWAHDPSLRPTMEQVCQVLTALAKKHDTRADHKPIPFLQPAGTQAKHWSRFFKCHAAVSEVKQASPQNQASANTCLPRFR